LQALFDALFGHRELRGNRGQGFLGGEPQDDLIETALVKAVECLQTRPNFLEMVSTTNEYRQTLAHLSIVYGYPSLLRHLVDWRIDLAISDVNGLTALHCAYMKSDMDSVSILRRGGGSETVMDKLGRTPSDLRPGGFDLDIDVEAETDSEVNPEMVNSEQLASGGQFSVPSGRTKNTRQPYVSSSLPDAPDPSSSTTVRPHPTKST
jgi:ankyrin repeat protein